MAEGASSPALPRSLSSSGADLAALATMATLFFLQAFRVFVPYLVFEVDQSDRQQLALTGAVVFALAVLGALLYRIAGGRRALWIAVTMLVAARFGFQFSENPDLRWKLAAAAVVAWCWILIVLLPQSTDRVATGIGFAFAIDLIFRALRGTLDLPWMPGPVEHLVTLALAAALVLATVSVTSAHRLARPEAGFVPSLRYAGIGSGIALWLVAAGNLGFAQVRGALDLPAAFVLLAIGTLLALASQTSYATRWLPENGDRTGTLVPGLLGLLAILVWDRDLNRWLALLLLPVFAFTVTALTMQAATAAPPARHHGRWRCGITLTLGLLLQTAFVFLFFARSGPIWLMVLPVAILSLAPLAGRTTATVPLSSPAILQRGVAILALLSAAVFGWLFLDTGDLGSQSPGAANLTVMTFNIQEGFSNENYWSLETTARTIEAHNPDIVFLQEITRGWLVMSSVDEVRWLANRLNMDYVYSGNSYDGLWGNAILSRLPIVSERSTIYSTTGNLRRGAIGVEVATEAGNLLVIDTHLDNLRKGTPVRLAQIQELIDFWGGAQPAVIAGDFNSDPGSPEWQAMVDAGFVDAAGDDPMTTSEDARRIDYLWVTPDLSVDAYMVVDVWASDHRPVVAALSLAP